MVSGVSLKTISTGCDVGVLALSSDGTLIGFICNVTRLFVYDTQTDVLKEQVNEHGNVTELRILGSQDMLVTEGGVVYHVGIKIRSEEKVRQEKEEDEEKVKEMSLQKEGMIEKEDKLEQRRQLMFEATSKVSAAVDYNAMTYAYSSDASSVSFSNFEGQDIDSFPLTAGEQVVSMAFAPDGLLTIATTQNNLITLTPADCDQNASTSNGYCICNPSFESVGSNCQCSSAHIYAADSCTC